MQTQFCSVVNIRPATHISKNEVQQTLKKTNIMKTVLLKISKMTTVVLAILLSITMNAQVNGWNPELENDSKEALNTILEKTPKLESFKNEAYGYAVFPRITKAAIGVGGAAGNGIVYKNDQAVGSSKLKQATVGIQFGPQS